MATIDLWPEDTAKSGARCNVPAAIRSSLHGVFDKAGTISDLLKKG